MLGISDRRRDRVKNRVLPPVYRSLRVGTVDEDIFRNRNGAVLDDREHEQVEVPSVELPEHRFRHHRSTEALVTRSLDRALARESVERVTNRRYAGVELVREERRLEPCAGPINPLPEPLLDRGINSVERARR